MVEDSQVDPSLMKDGGYRVSNEHASAPCQMSEKDLADIK